MRMWLVDVKKLCRQHLLGEHLEMHMFRGVIIKGCKIEGYIKGGLVELGKIKMRHDMLVREMKRRGYNHNSPLLRFREGRGGYIDVKGNIEVLCMRCKDCRRVLG